MELHLSPHQPHTSERLIPDRPLRAMRRSCTTAVSRRLRANAPTRHGQPYLLGRWNRGVLSNSPSAQPALTEKSAPPERNRSPDGLFGAFFVADFQAFEVRNLAELRLRNAHRGAGLLQGGDELVGLLVARIGGVETNIRLDRDLGISLFPFRDGRCGVIGRSSLDLRGGAEDKNSTTCGPASMRPSASSPRSTPRIAS